MENEIKQTNGNMDLEKEIESYNNRIKEYLTIEMKVKELKWQGLSYDKIREIIGNKIDILNKVPDILYHGSPKELDIIKAKESTQRGSYVYTTNSPVRALFFSVFRNSGIAGVHIKEYIDKNGEYKIKYIINEKVNGALENLITNSNITVHVCDGKDFFKPQGQQFIDREWCSKDGKDVIPIKKINVNVKQFFDKLEKDGLVEYNRYNKENDWKTVCDFLGNNYPFGLQTQKANDIVTFDKNYDDFIKEFFPEQYEFSKYIREDIKKIMKYDYKELNMSEKDLNDYKLKQTRDITNNFLIKSKDEKGNIKYLGNIEKINEYINKNKSIEKSK